MGCETVWPRIIEKHKSRGVKKEGGRMEVGKGRGKSIYGPKLQVRAEPHSTADCRQSSRSQVHRTIQWRQ